MKITEIVRPKIACVFAIFLLTLYTALAQSSGVSFEAQGPLSVAPQQRFQVVFTLTNAKGADFQEPEFGGLKVLMGPMVSNMSSYSMVNGTTTSTTSEVYTYYVEADGTQKIATIGPATITVDAKKYKTKPLKIDVGAGSSQQTATTRQGQQQRQQQHSQSGQNEPKKALLRLELNKTNVYQGEAIAAELVMYSPGNISGINNFEMPSFRGFWAVEVDVPQGGQGERRTLGGELYQAFPLRRWLLYPQQSGQLSIDPAVLNVTAQEVVAGRSQNPFDQIFGTGQSVVNVPLKLTAPARKITVKSLPAGAPIGVPVAVGEFTLESSISAESIDVNRAGTFTVKLRGTGDFPLIQTPDFKLPSEFESYDVKTTDTLRNTLAGGTRGLRVWEFPFVARSEGQYTIPSIELVAFSPKTKKYTTLRTPEYTVNVRRGSGLAGSGVGPIVGGVSKEELQILGQDIRHIVAQKPSAGRNMLLFSPLFFILLFAMIIGTLALIFLQKVREKTMQDTKKVRRRGANKMAVRRLKKAHRELVAQRPEKFHTEVLGAVWGFMSDRFGLQPAELTKDKIRAELHQRGIEDNISDGFIEILEECEMAKYGMGATTAEAMQELYDRALRLLF